MTLYATEAEALIALEKMTDEEFNRFLQKCPERVQMLVRSHMVDWQEILPEWYMILPF